MPVIIDYNLCDGVQDCAAIRMCDAEALFFDASTGRIEYDKGKCRNCGTCANYCGPSAILHVPSEEEWEEIRAMTDAQNS